MYNIELRKKIKDKWSIEKETGSVEEVIPISPENNRNCALVIVKEKRRTFLINHEFLHICPIFYYCDDFAEIRIEKLTSEQIIRSYGGLLKSLSSEKFSNLNHVLKKAIDAEAIVEEKFPSDLQGSNVINILLIGKTGSGKSSLANTLLNDKKNFEEGGEFSEFFKESSGGISETKMIKIRSFKENGLTYQIIDTIGIYDTKSDPVEVWNKIVKESRAIEGGLHWIVFVGRGKFTGEIPKAYQLLTDILGQEVSNHIITVRSDFPRFCNYKDCFEDYKELVRENEGIKNMVTLSSDFIYVDNPPIPVIEEGDDEDEREDKEEEMRVNRKKRKESKKMLLEALENIKKRKEKNKERMVYEGSEELKNYLGKEKFENIKRYIKRERKIDEKLEKLGEENLRELKEVYERIKKVSQDKYLKDVEGYVKKKINCGQNNFREEAGSTNNRPNPSHGDGGMSSGVALLGIFFGSIIKGLSGL